ncbi:MAG: hypothetical protein ACREPL_09990, partial [Rhodanobacteraceae bacterium]
MIDGAVYGHSAAGRDCHARAAAGPLPDPLDRQKRAGLKLHLVPRHQISSTNSAGCSVWPIACDASSMGVYSTGHLRRYLARVGLRASIDSAAIVR